MRRLLEYGIAIFLISGFACEAEAVLYGAQFSLVSSQIESSTAVVNSSTLDVHPPLQAQDWDDDGVLPNNTTNFSVGDGHHGSFGLATFLSFVDGTYNNDGIIRINTDTYPDLQFTDFTLPTGYQIVPTGSRPLIIRALGSVDVSGHILCSGGNGGDIGSALIPAGGTGRCGGSMGGSGGTALFNASAGSQSSSNLAVAGGGAATSQGDGDGGGGGAGMDQSAPGASVGINGGLTAGGGGTAGNGGTDSSFSSEGGGAGGGGGAAFTDLSDPAGASTGAGGGAGGGSVYIYAVGNVTVAGTISADGGAGGGGIAPAKGGGGGGGAGGSILMFSAGTITINGIASAVGGAAGVTPGGDGGQGGSGRTWVIDQDSVPTLGALNSLEPLGILINWGQVNYRIGTTTVVSKTIDLDNSKPTLDSVTVSATGTAGGNSATVEIASSDSPFTAAAAVWNPSTALIGTKIKRYVRLRVTLDNQVAATPIRVSAVSLNVTPGDQNDFDFASCSMVKALPPPSGPSSGFMILAMMLPFATALLLRERSRRVVARK